MASSEDYPPDSAFDLRQFGYQEPKDRQLMWAYQGLKNSIIFVDNDTLAVSFFVQNRKPGLSVRGQVLGGAHLFQTLYLEWKSGKVLRSQQWSNSGIGRGIFPSENGRFVVWHDLELDLHAPDGKFLKALAMDPKRFPRGFTVEQSPSGRTLFVVRIDHDGNHVYSYRTADLQEGISLDFPGYFSDAGSDSYFAFLRPRAKINPPMDLFVFRLARKVPASSAEKPVFTAEPGCNSVVFLDDETLGVSGQCPDLTLVSTSGELQYHRRFEGVLTGAITACRTCDLLFFSTYVLSRGTAFVDIFPKAKSKGVVLLDRKTGQRVEWQRKTSVKHPHVGSAALSPDGCALAILNDWHLETYRICGSSIGKKLQTGQTADRGSPAQLVLGGASHQD
jgi:hypothetical protein